jgi:hypothetical protein
MSSTHNKNQNEKIKIIVAKYNEDTSWLWNYKQYVLIYNKGEPIINNPYFYNISNVGREGHTYLHYIINNWGYLPDKIFFTQGKINDHTTYSLIKYLFSDEPLVINLNCNKTNCYNMWGHVNVRGTIYNNITKSKYTYGEWWDIYIKKTRPTYKNFRWSAGSIFSVSNKLIYQNTKEYYINLLNTLSHCNNPEEGHYIERSWYYIFNLSNT